MARLNIEDSFWLESIQLVASVGDQDKAIGNAVRFFRHAQERHKQGELITEDEFKRLGFLENLIPLFAERVDGGIRAVGAEKHFNWLLTKSEAGHIGGRVSAQRQRDERGRLISKQEPSKSQAQPSSPSTAKHSQASPSPSPSISNSSIKSITAVTKVTRTKAEPTDFKTVDELKLGLESEKLDEWAKLYPDSLFVEREMIKAFGYYRDNPRKKPNTVGGWKRALGSWFERGWPRHVRSIPGQSKPKHDVDAWMESILGEEQEGT